MTEIGIFMAIGVVAVAVSLHMKDNYLMWIVTAIPWAIMSASGIRQSTALWDIYFFSFWIGLGATIACVMMVLQTRSLQKEEMTEEKPETNDVDNYMEEVEAYNEKQGKLSKATASRRRSR